MKIVENGEEKLRRQRDFILKQDRNEKEKAAIGGGMLVRVATN